MPFCKRCGAELAADARFCTECGCPADSAPVIAQTQRKQIFDGEIRKCPNCGAVLNAFESTCLSCGFELRGARVSSVVQDFSRLLDSVSTEKNTSTEPSLTVPFGKRKSKKEIEAELEAEKEKRQERKLNLIQSFPIPNTKEDIVEFMILAGANMVPPSSDGGSDAEAMYNMWAAKFEQAYQKAKISFGTDASFHKIQELYISKKEEYKAAKFRENLPNIIVGILLALFFLIPTVISLLK